MDAKQIERLLEAVEVLSARFDAYSEGFAGELLWSLTGNSDTPGDFSPPIGKSLERIAIALEKIAGAA